MISAGESANYETLHEELSGLLDYFHLPVAVTSYLPPISSLDLRHGQLISFMYTAHDLEQAHMVVGTMLSFKPHKAAQQPRGAAAFLVTADTSDALPKAEVYLLVSPPQHLLSSIVQQSDSIPFTIAYTDPHPPHSSVNVMRTRAAKMCEKGDLAESETITSVLRLNSLSSRCQCVAANGEWLGQRLLRASAAHLPKGLRGGCCEVHSRSCQATATIIVAVWVLIW